MQAPQRPAAGPVALSAQERRAADTDARPRAAPAGAGASECDGLRTSDEGVLRTVQRWLEAGERACLFTVVRTWGSSPRPAGSLLALHADGRVAGSVSGGCVEEELIARRTELMGRSTPCVLRFGGDAEERARLRLPCRGALELVLEPRPVPGSIRGVLAALSRRERALRQVQMSSGAARVTVPEPGGQPVLFDGAVLQREFGPRARLLLVGAAELSGFVARIAPALGYEVYVFEPREEYAAHWDVPASTLLRVLPEGRVSELAGDAHAAVLALSHDPRLDDLVLMEALASEAFYVGALGSRTSQARRRERLRALGLEAAAIARLHGPVGLPIGSRTPAEIAISILAALTAERHRREAAAAPARAARG